ncbi:MAG: hypothetical protein M5R41_10020 [Bacteroidia bacterium]|nr:hypothetical protein [Bacteroidia bacterium]
MNLRFLFVLLLLTLFFLRSGDLSAQTGPRAGSSYTVVYNPPSASPLSQSKAVTMFYVFDYWNVRYGTRMALWQNVLRPDTNRLRSAEMQRVAEGWTATIEIPEDAALLSWIVSDGVYMDGNLERTYVEYVLGGDGKPVRNARYFNIQFLRLAGSEIGILIREMERELADYPTNFPAYHQYFSLLMEQSKGNTKIQERIANRLGEMEKQFGDDDEFLNLAAQTWYYLLQDQKRGLDFRERIAPSRQWPQVLRMFDRDAKQAEVLERQMQAQTKRSQLLNTELPAFNLNNPGGGRTSFPRGSGRPTLLLFWASTSERSLQKIDALKEIIRMNATDIDVYYVNVDVDESKALDVARAKGIVDQVLLNQGATLAILGVDSLPMLFAVDSRDIIRDIQIGFSAQQVEELSTILPGLRQ